MDHVIDHQSIPHVLLFPFSAQGHVIPMLKLAKLISKQDDNLLLTFLTTEDIHTRLLHSSPEIFLSFSKREKARFLSIPDGLSEDHPRPIMEVIESMEVNSRRSFRDVLDSFEGWPRVTCVIADGVLPLALEVPDEMDIPVMIFRASSACGVLAYCSIPKLIEHGDIPFSEQTDLDELVQVVEGMESFLRRRDLPGLIRSVKSTSEPTIQLIVTNNKNIKKAKALILNTTEDLESTALSHLRSNTCPTTYTIGPLQHLDKNHSRNINPLLWQEDRSCIEWLNGKEHKSVVYVSFGSITVISQVAFHEFWHGLVDSGYSFLWVIRPDMLQGADADHTKMEYRMVDGLEEKCCLVKWAPQEEVLAHPAVGCFFTHSGWNSTLESVLAGVPMICWPFFSDQQINSRFVESVWKIGVDIKDSCDREVVEMAVRKVMMEEVYRERASEVGEMVKASVQEGGSSCENLRNMIERIRMLSSRS